LRAEPTGADEFPELTGRHVQGTIPTDCIQVDDEPTDRCQKHIPGLWREEPRTFRLEAVFLSEKSLVQGRIVRDDGNFPSQVKTHSLEMAQVAECKFGLAGAGPERADRNGALRRRDRCWSSVGKQSALNVFERSVGRCKHRSLKMAI
jgi:hypothetical protein